MMKHVKQLTAKHDVAGPVEAQDIGTLLAAGKLAEGNTFAARKRAADDKHKRSWHD